MTNPLYQDLDHILQHTLSVFQELKDKSIFITGGTGFFGLWFLETIAWANKNHHLGIKAVILTRNPGGVKIKAQHLFNDPAFEFITGDIRDFEFPGTKFQYIIHGATTNARETFDNEDNLKKYDTVAEGTRRLLEFSVECDASKVLYISSGSLYGDQPQGMTHIKETFSGAPRIDERNAALGMGKRTAEFYCKYFAERYDLEIKIARCFTFFGPYLPLDIHYAVGNFFRNGIRNEDIEILGDGTPERSYLYIADLMVWLWIIFLKGENLEPYNVGSDKGMSIRHTADIIANYFQVGVRVNQSEKVGRPLSRYVPSVSKAKDKLGLNEIITFDEGVDRLASHISIDPALYLEKMAKL